MEENYIYYDNIVEYNIPVGVCRYRKILMCKRRKKDSFDEMHRWSQENLNLYGIKGMLLERD